MMRRYPPKVGWNHPATVLQQNPLAGDVSDFVNSDAISTASGVALVYHGYKRTGSLVWALIYGALGKWKPAIAVPVAFAQGFGKRKPCP